MPFIISLTTIWKPKDIQYTVMLDKEKQQVGPHIKKVESANAMPSIIKKVADYIY